MSYFNTEKLNVGDDVAVIPAHLSGALCTFHKVAKLTKMQITLGDGSKFNRRNGRAWGAGDSWYYRSLANVEDGKARNVHTSKEIKHRRLLKLIDDKINKNTPVEQLEKIAEILK